MNNIIKFSTALFALVILPGFAWSNPMVKLVVSDSNIAIGQTFSVDVFAPGYLDETNAGGALYDGLLAFGFDTTWGNLLKFDGATVPGMNDDSSFTYDGVGHVAGSAFPASSDPNLLLSQLTFTALGVGSDAVSLSGLVDGFHGLFYDVGQNIDIDASLAITISPAGQQPVPDAPLTIWLVAGTWVGILGLVCRRLRKTTMIGIV